MGSGRALARSSRNVLNQALAVMNSPHRLVTPTHACEQSQSPREFRARQVQYIWLNSYSGATAATKKRTITNFVNNLERVKNIYESIAAHTGNRLGPPVNHYDVCLTKSL